MRRGEPWSLKEVGEEFELSRERIRQIEASALQKLRGRETAEMLSDFINSEFAVSRDTTPHLHMDVPIQPQERPGWGVTFWDSAPDWKVDRALALRADQLARVGKTKWDELTRQDVVKLRKMGVDIDHPYMRAPKDIEEDDVSKETREEKFLRLVNMTRQELLSGTDCLVWPLKVHRSGYGNFCYGNKNPETAHRVAYELFRGKLRQGDVVVVTCGTAGCVRPTHLERTARGSRWRGVLLREVDVAEIRAIPKDEIDVYELAEHYGVSRAAIDDVIVGRTWKRVKPGKQPPNMQAKKDAKTAKTGPKVVRNGEEPLRSSAKSSRPDERIPLRPEVEIPRFLKELGVSREELFHGTDCVLWPRRTRKSGAGVYSTAESQRDLTVHTVSYQLFVGPLRATNMVMQTCGNRLCVRPSHLEQMTRSEFHARRHAAKRAAEAKDAKQTKVELESHPDPTPMPVEVESVSSKPEPREPEAGNTVVHNAFMSTKHEGRYAVDFWVSDVPLTDAIGDGYEMRINGDITWASEGEEIGRQIGRIVAHLVRTNMITDHVKRAGKPEAVSRRLFQDVFSLLLGKVEPGAVRELLNVCSGRDVLTILQLGVECSHRGRGAGTAAIRRLCQVFGSGAMVLAESKQLFFTEGIFTVPAIMMSDLESQQYRREFWHRLGFTRTLQARDTGDLLLASGSLVAYPRQVAPAPEQKPEPKPKPKPSPPKPAASKAASVRRNGRISSGTIVKIGSPAVTHLVDRVVGKNVRLLCDRVVPREEVMPADPAGLRKCRKCRRLQIQNQRREKAAGRVISADGA